MAYLHPDKLVAVDRILLRKKAKQGVRQRSKKTPTVEAVAANAFSKPKRRPTPRTQGMIGRLAARL